MPRPKPIFRISTDYARNWKEQIAPFARKLARPRKDTLLDYSRHSNRLLETLNLIPFLYIREMACHIKMK